ncbi:unnamed protein product [Soboliphyme baturini]|uniref:Calponin-homology (CH) domain-containing protein n=1 Tax=Soboliphyme baturini TaxID=241478 RepID=A0A183IUU0_9BILA|nr:unnamed protein product [Soboliphyme baturini]
MMLATPVSLGQIQNGTLPTYAYLASPTYQPETTVTSSTETTSFASPVQTVGEMKDKWAEVFGKGLKTACVGKTASFEITAPCLSNDDIDVIVTFANGKKIPCKVVALSSTNYLCEYIPTEVGVYRVDLKICGRSVDGSPFLVSTYEPMKVLIEPFSGDVVGKPVQFLVDASEAGKGQLEISINKGQIPNNVQLHGAGKCLVTFIPEKVGTYVIDVTLNGDLVRGCPVRVEIFESTTERAAAHAASRSSSTYSLNLTNSTVPKYLAKSNLSSALSLSPRTQITPAPSHFGQKEGNVGSRIGGVTSPSLTPSSRTFGSGTARVGTNSYLNVRRTATNDALKAVTTAGASHIGENPSVASAVSADASCSADVYQPVSPNLNGGLMEPKSSGDEMYAQTVSAAGHDEKVAMSDQMVQKNEYICADSFNVNFHSLTDHWKAKSQENVLSSPKKPSFKYFDTDAMKSMSQSESTVPGTQSPLLPPPVEQLQMHRNSKSPRPADGSLKNFTSAKTAEQPLPPSLQSHVKEPILPKSLPPEDYVLNETRAELRSTGTHGLQQQQGNEPDGNVVNEELKLAGDTVISKANQRTVVHEGLASSFDTRESNGKVERFTPRETCDLSLPSSPLASKDKTVVDKADIAPVSTLTSGKQAVAETPGPRANLAFAAKDILQQMSKNMKALWHQTVIESSTNGVLRLGATARYVLKNCFSRSDEVQVSVTHLNETVPVELHMEKFAENELTVQFVPPDVGAYKVHFSSMDEAHPSSPLILKVYNPDMVKISDIIGKTAGKPVQFTGTLFA